GQPHSFGAVLSFASPPATEPCSLDSDRRRTLPPPTVIGRAGRAGSQPPTSYGGNRPGGRPWPPRADALDVCKDDHDARTDTAHGMEQLGLFRPVRHRGGGP